MAIENIHEKYTEVVVFVERLNAGHLNMPRFISYYSNLAFSFPVNHHPLMKISVSYYYQAMYLTWFALKKSLDPIFFSMPYSTSIIIRVFLPRL